jgi:hypothetical protein
MPIIAGPLLNIDVKIVGKCLAGWKVVDSWSDKRQRLVGMTAWTSIDSWLEKRP